MRSSAVTGITLGTSLTFVLVAACLYTKAIYQGAPGAEVECPSELCSYVITVDEASLAACYPGGPPYPAPMDSCSGPPDDCEIASDVYAWDGDFCLGWDSSTWDDQCHSAIENSFDEFGYILDALLEEIQQDCPMTTSIASADCEEVVGPTPVLDTGCSYPKEYEGVDAVLTIDPEYSSILVAKSGTMNSGEVPVSGELSVAQPGTVLLGTLTVPDQTIGIHTFEHNFLSIDADLTFDAEGGGYFTVPADQENLSGFSSVYDDEGTSWAVELTEDGTGRLNSGTETWYFDYESTVSGYHVVVHLQGAIDE